MSVTPQNDKQYVDIDGRTCATGVRGGSMIRSKNGSWYYSNKCADREKGSRASRKNYNPRRTSKVVALDRQRKDVKRVAKAFLRSEKAEQKRRKREMKEVARLVKQFIAFRRKKYKPRRSNDVIVAGKLEKRLRKEKKEALRQSKHLTKESKRHAKAAKAAEKALRAGGKRKYNSRRPKNVIAAEKESKRLRKIARENAKAQKEAERMAVVAENDAEEIDNMEQQLEEVFEEVEMIPAGKHSFSASASSIKKMKKLFASMNENLNLYDIAVMSKLYRKSPDKHEIRGDMKITGVEFYGSSSMKLSGSRKELDVKNKNATFEGRICRKYPGTKKDDCARGKFNPSNFVVDISHR
jgi:hypothetical protein